MAADPMMTRASQVIERSPIGVLMTVDENGVPHGRWMGVTTRHGLHTLYTLTAKATRKVAQLRSHPEVTWLFTSDDFEEVVSLSGTATVHDGPVMVREAWERLKETGRTYALGPFSDDENLEMCVIETQVTRVELTCPELELPTPRELALS